MGLRELVRYCFPRRRIPRSRRERGSSMSCHTTSALPPQRRQNPEVSLDLVVGYAWQIAVWNERALLHVRPLKEDAFRLIVP